MLFSILIADMEERMSKRLKGGTILGSKKLYSLAYADNIVLLAEDERGMRLMIKEFKRYAEEKNLRVNV